MSEEIINKAKELERILNEISRGWRTLYIEQYCSSFPRLARTRLLKYYNLENITTNDYLFMISKWTPFFSEYISAYNKMADKGLISTGYTGYISHLSDAIYSRERKVSLWEAFKKGIVELIYLSEPTLSGYKYFVFRFVVINEKIIDDFLGDPQTTNITIITKEQAEILRKAKSNLLNPENIEVVSVYKENPCDLIGVKLTF
jgi:hypothetical protein